jgi:hypothetical protein
MGGISDSGAFGDTGPSGMREESWDPGGQRWFWDIELSPWPFVWYVTVVPAADVESPMSVIRFTIFAVTEERALRKAGAKMRIIVDRISDAPF